MTDKISVCEVVAHTVTGYSMVFISELEFDVIVKAVNERSGFDARLVDGSPVYILGCNIFYLEFSDYYEVFTEGPKGWERVV